MQHLRYYDDFKKITNFEKLIADFKTLRLPLTKQDFAIYGSAPLVVRGMLEDVNDLDIIIKPEKWPFTEDSKFSINKLEFFDFWPDEDVNDLIDNHTFEWKGMKFVNVDKVIEYKKRMGRDKDMNLWE
jgi:hypothetical protein